MLPPPWASVLPRTAIVSICGHPLGGAGAAPAVGAATTPASAMPATAAITVTTLLMCTAFPFLHGSEPPIGRIKWAMRRRIG